MPQRERERDAVCAVLLRTPSHVRWSMGEGLVHNTYLCIPRTFISNCYTPCGRHWAEALPHTTLLLFRPPSHPLCGTVETRVRENTHETTSVIVWKGSRFSLFSLLAGGNKKIKNKKKESSCTRCVQSNHAVIVSSLAGRDNDAQWEGVGK